MKRISIYLVFIFVLMILPACGAGVTEVCNPSSCTTQTDSTSSSTTADQILGGFCDRLRSCFEEDGAFTSCEDDLLSNTDLLDGLGASDYSDFTDLQTDLTDGTLTFVDETLESCLADVDAMECTSLVLADFIGESPTYASFGTASPTSCEELFTN